MRMLLYGIAMFFGLFFLAALMGAIAEGTPEWTWKPVMIIIIVILGLFVCGLSDWEAKQRIIRRLRKKINRQDVMEENDFMACFEETERLHALRARAAMAALLRVSVDKVHPDEKLPSALLVAMCVSVCPEILKEWEEERDTDIFTRPDMELKHLVRELAEWRKEYRQRTHETDI